MKVKIFCSYRIDITTKEVSSGVLTPVRCGACYDSRKDCSIIGDNSGENISEKRLPYCEGTVAYWAWKNQGQHDFIGLCHYRRFLSFAHPIELSKENVNCFNQIEVLTLSDSVITRYGMASDTKIKKLCNKYKVILPLSSPVRTIANEVFGRSAILSVRQLWEAHEGVFFPKGSVSVFLGVILEQLPEMYPFAVNYFEGENHRGFNCFIFQRDIYDDFCSKAFALLEVLEKKMENSGFNRDVGYFFEMFFGVYSEYLIHQKSEYCEVPIVFVRYPKERKLSSEFCRVLLSYYLKFKFPHVFAFARKLYKYRS